MTLPPNFSVPADQPGHPGHGYPPPYAGAPQPPQKPRNYALIGGIIVGTTVLALGTTLLIALGLTRGGDEDEPAAVGGEEETTSPTPEATTTPAPEETTSAAAAGADEIGYCLPYEPVILGAGLELMDCGDDEAFWEIMNMSYDVGATVDDEGNLTDNQVAYDLCGDEYGISYLGELWTNWHWVYTSGAVDSLYCIAAVGTPGPEGKLPYTPDTGDCFDDSDKWWTVDCASDLAKYEVVDTVEFDDPKELSEDEAGDAATCGGTYYWQVNDVEGRTTAILCGDNL